MNASFETSSLMTSVCSFLLTYLIHSTLAIAAFALTARCLKNARYSELRVLSWKFAIVLPLLTTVAISFLPIPHFGVQLALNPSNESTPDVQSPKPVTPVRTKVIPTEPVEEFDDSRALFPVEDELVDSEFIGGSTASPVLQPSRIVVAAAGAWLMVAVGGLVLLCVQLKRLRCLRKNASVITEPVVTAAFDRISNRLKVSRRVDLLQSSETNGPLTAGVLRPFILLPTGLDWTGQSNTPDSQPDLAETEAVLAHELAHIAHRDACWNFVTQLMIRLFPFQPLNYWAARQLKKNMDFVADLHASRALGARAGLIRCLLRLGQRIVMTDRQRIIRSELAAGMVAFRSTLGQRVDALLKDPALPYPLSRRFKLGLLASVTSLALLASTLIPQAVAETPAARNKTMKAQLATLALLIGLTSPTVADAYQETTAAPEKAAELKTTPDELPAGIRSFNGMLLGRLAAKDVEKGTFVVRVDAVPRVWRNSRAENPKSIVGKTIEVGGVFGKFLDVLVVTRTGETLEFECKHDGEKLVFPGEMLRKTAPYKAEDYPELPEEFRGFRGSLNAEVVKKDQETFELILKVHKVTESGKESAAKKPDSIEGKNMMLAGFWNRKDVYHGLKVGDRIQVNVQHIARQSDHLNVESVRKAGDTPRENKERREDPVEEGGLSREMRGFRGMLVGRLVEKDIERGTFTIKVDAVPRVWQNNRSSNPKAFIGQHADVERVHGKMLDALVVTRVGETVEFGALHEEGPRLRVGEVLRKVAPVKEGDYPVLPDEFRGFKGMIVGKVVKKDDQLLDLVVEVKSVDRAFEGSRAIQADSIVGKSAMLAGFWKRRETFNSIDVGDTIRCGVDHQQQLTDHLTVIESVKKIEE